MDNTTTNALEPLVWTVPETAPKTVTTGAGFGSGANSDVNAVADDETYVTVTSRAIKEGWGRRREVVVPRKEEFMSALTESHRKGEPAWHVKAFRGSKEGEFGNACHQSSFYNYIAFNFSSDRGILFLSAILNSVSCAYVHFNGLYIHRLPFLPTARHPLGLQETNPLLSLNCHLKRQLHLHPPTYF